MRILLLLLLPLELTAATWTNQFVQFELPTNWGCTLEEAEWVCQSKGAAKRDALIVLVAKIRSDADDLEQYLTYLQKQKNYESILGKAVASKVEYAKKASIKSLPWVDSVHVNSEMPGYMTRYLATVKEDIAVLVTYSIRSSKRKLYEGELDKLAESLRVFRQIKSQFDSGDRNTDLGSFPGSDVSAPLFSRPTGTLSQFFEEGSQGARGGQGGRRGGQTLEFLLFLFIGILAVIIIVRRRNKK